MTNNNLNDLDRVLIDSCIPRSQLEIVQRLGACLLQFTKDRNDFAAMTAKIEEINKDALSAYKLPDQLNYILLDDIIDEIIDLINERLTNRGLFASWENGDLIILDND